MKKFAIFVASLMLLSGCSAVSDTVKTEEKPETNTEQNMTDENDGQGKSLPSLRAALLVRHG